MKNTRFFGMLLTVLLFLSGCYPLRPMYEQEDADRITQKGTELMQGWLTQIVLCLLVGEKITNPNPSPIRKKFGFANFGDPYGNRTHVTAVKGRCLNRLTNGPGSGNLIRTDDIPGMNRLLYQLSYAAMCGQRVSAPPKPACVL